MPLLEQFIFVVYSFSFISKLYSYPHIVNKSSVFDVCPLHFYT